MREHWARIDATGEGDGIGPTTWVAGLPVVARLVRQAERVGCRGAVIVGGDQVEIAKALASWPAREGFSIEYSDVAATAATERDLLMLDARAIYTPDELAAAAKGERAPAPLLELNTRADVRKANHELLHRTRKTIDGDGVVAYFVFRPISRLITRALLHTRVTPNQVSLLAMAFGIAAAMCAAVGSGPMVAIAGALYWVGAVIDCVDGELARLRVQGSKLGEWLDTFADDVSTFGLMAGVGIGMVRDGYSSAWQWTAIGAALLGFLLNLKLYLDLHRWGMMIDTARYPWFFGTPASGADARTGFLSRAVYVLNFLFRRDAVVTCVAICFFLGLRQPALVALVAGVIIFTLLFIAHGIVVSRRREHDGESFWTIGYFGIKDVFTVINLIGAVGGIYFAFQGKLDWAGYSIFIGYLLGDVLDGPVARWTGTSNRFGSEFDAAADHVAQAVAPSIIVYVAFTMGGHQTLGLVLLAVLLTTASIRQARFAVATFDYPLTYCGLPRTVSGLIAISLPNSVLFFKYSWLGYSGAAAILILVAVMNLCPIPYMGHKGRTIQGYVKLFVAFFLLVPPVMMLFAPEFVFDVLFVITFGYALGAWIPLHPHERREFWAEYTRWSNEVARRK